MEAALKRARVRRSAAAEGDVFGGGPNPSAGCELGASDTAESEEEAEGSDAAEEVDEAAEDAAACDAAALLGRVAEMERLMSAQGKSALPRLRALRALAQDADARLAAAEEQHLAAHRKSGTKRVLETEFIADPFSVLQACQVRPSLLECACSSRSNRRMLCRGAGKSARSSGPS